MRLCYAPGQTPRWDSLCILSFKKSGCLHPKCIWRCRLGSDADFIRLTSELLCSLRPLAEQHGISLKELGDFDTLPDRICAEVVAANTVVSLIAVVGAWSRKPTESPRSAD